MHVRMLVTYGEGWPLAGETADLDDNLATELIERGEAEPATGKAPKVETASVDGATETAVKRGPGRPRKAAS